MVRYDEPLPVDPAEQKGIHTADVPFPAAFEKPFPDDEIMIRREPFDPQEREEKLSHLIRIVIYSLVTDQRTVIAIGNGVTDESQRVIVPVSFHIIIDVAVVPGGHLVGKYLTDGRFGRGLGKAGGYGQVEEGGEQDFFHTSIFGEITYSSSISRNIAFIFSM
jgi:hypothetical protein